MKLHLHGPREGQTINIRGIQFIDGVAEHHTLPETLRKYYGVKDYSPNEDVQDNQSSINNEQEEVMNDGLQVEEQKIEEEVAIKVSEEDITEQEEAQKELRELIESKKQELSVEKLKTFKEFNNFGKWKSYIKELTGITVKNKVMADETMRKYAKENNLEYGDDS